MGKQIGSGLTALKDFARRCLAAGGIPIFRTRYGGKRLPNNSVVAACWGKGDTVKGGTITDVPLEIIERMEKETGDYKWLLRVTKPIFLLFL